MERGLGNEQMYINPLKEKSVGKIIILTEKTKWYHMNVSYTGDYKNWNSSGSTRLLNYSIPIDRIVIQIKPIL